MTDEWYGRSSVRREAFVRSKVSLVFGIAAALLGAACSSGYRARPHYGGSDVGYVGGAVQPSVQPVQFRFDVGDEIAVSVWKEPDLTTQQRILGDGTISPPLLRSTRVVGATVDEIQARLERAYLEYLKEPKVSVKVVAIHSDRVFVLGEVKTPQAVSLVGPTTVMQAIAMAGGFNEEFAQKASIRVIRRACDGSPEVIGVDGKRVLAGADADLPLRRGDIVYVSPTGTAAWSRTVGQALAPISSAVGTAGTVAALVIAGQN